MTLLGLAVLGLLVAFVAWNQAVRQIAVPRLTADVRATRGSVPFGSRVELLIHIENPTRVPCPLVQCRIPLPAGLDLPEADAARLGSDRSRTFGEKAVAFSVSLGAREAVTVHVGLIGSERGRQAVQVLKLRVSDGFTVMRDEESYPLRLSVIVHPRRLAPIGRRLPLMLLGATASQQKLTPTSVDWVDLRDYQPGDSVRDVAWMISARRGNLIVMERDTARHQQLVVVTSVRVSSVPWEARDDFADHVYETAQALIEEAALKDGECLLFADGYWGDGRGRVMRHQVLRLDGGWTAHNRLEAGHILGTLSSHSSVTLDRLLAEVRRTLPSPTRVVVVADFVDDAARRAMTRLGRDGHQVDVVRTIAAEGAAPM